MTDTREDESIPNLSNNAKRRLFELVGYPQLPCLMPKSAEEELASAGLLDTASGQETPKAHHVAETLLFC